MDPEIYNKLMLKNKINYELINPDYDEWLRQGSLDSESVELLKYYTNLNYLNKLELIKTNKLICKILLNATYATGPGLLRSYSLQHLYDICRIDNNIYNILLEILNDRDVYSIYYDIATHEKDKKIIEKTLFLLTGFIGYGNEKFNEEQVENVVNLILKLSIDNYSKLHSLSNILQLKKYHKLILNENILNLIKSNLDNENLPNSIYKCVYCVWLVSRSPELIKFLYDNGVIHLLCSVLVNNKIEKIIRICLLLFKNLLSNTHCLEVMLDNNILQTLTLLAYDKWNDSELYDNIHKLHILLENKTNKLSNFERYCSELNSGTLKWSILHSEKFWSVHNEKFEQDEFVNIIKLINLLNSQDHVTASIACYDLGEFIRFNKNGKRICKKMKVRDQLIKLINHHHRDVSRQAMLCIQKLMVNNYQQIINNNANEPNQN